MSTGIVAPYEVVTVGTLLDARVAIAGNAVRSAGADRSSGDASCGLNSDRANIAAIYYRRAIGEGPKAMKLCIGHRRADASALKSRSVQLAASQKLLPSVRPMPNTSSCPADWSDSYNFDCAMYAGADWCTPSGQRGGGSR